MHLEMMDEDLQRVLLFLVDTLSKCPGWAHQGMLKQELLTAPIDGCLHRMLGSSSAETFADFLKCFSNIFCVSNANQLVQLYVKNGNTSADGSSMNLIGNEGIPLMKHDECIMGGTGGGGGVMPNLGALPVGIRKPLDTSHSMEWNSPMAVAPECSSGGVSGKISGYMCRDQHMPSASLCGIPANYATRSSALHAHRCGSGGRVGGWDPVAHSLPDLQQSFLDSSMSHNSSIGHLANGWERPVRPTTVPNCQMRYDGGGGDPRYGHQRYSWDAGNVVSHSLSDSLKNFTISDDNGYSPSPPPPHTYGNATATAEATRGNRWMSYSALGGSDTLDGFANNHAAGDSRFMRPMSSVWDDALRPTIPSPPPPATQPPPPPNQPAYLNRDGNSLATMMNSHVSSTSSFKGWNEEDDVSYSGFPLGSSAKPTPQQQQQQQYYKWKSSSSPPITVEPPLPTFPSPEVLLEEKNLVEPDVDPMVQTTLSPLGAILTPPIVTPLIVEEEEEEEMGREEEEEEEEEIKCDLVLARATKTSEGASPSVGDTPPSKCGTTLSYAEALRSNTQRRRTGSESGLPSSSNQSSILTVVSSLKSPAGNNNCTERASKNRRSLDGRCGKVETLTCGDGVLRLGNGKVYFEKNVFYDSGKQVADLRNILKANDTVYFDATPDGSNHHEWRATLAWVGKKPRSASSSSPTVTASSNSGGRGTYRSLSEGNHPNTTTTSNGVRSSSGNHSSVKEANSSSSSVMTSSTSLESTVEGNGEVVILFAHFGFIRRGKKFKENVHFNRNVFYASGNRVKELTDTLKEGNTVNYIAVPSDKKSCKWKAVLVWTGPRPKV